MTGTWSLRLLPYDSWKSLFVLNTQWGVLTTRTVSKGGTLNWSKICCSSLAQGEEERAKEWGKARGGGITCWMWSGGVGKICFLWSIVSLFLSSPCRYWHQEILIIQQSYSKWKSNESHEVLCKNIHLDWIQASGEPNLPHDVHWKSF